MSNGLWVLCALAAFFANALVGAMVLSSIDDENRSLLTWYRGCPAQIAWLMQPLVLTAWPIVAAIWLMRGRIAGE